MSHIIPPFYQTWWFYLLCLLAISSIVYAVFQYRIAQILKVERLRTRIASDLHDSLGGLLSTIKLQLANLDTPQKINQLLDKATSEVRDISQNLQPSSLEQFGLLTALQDLISMYNRYQACLDCLTEGREASEHFPS